MVITFETPSQSVVVLLGDVLPPVDGHIARALLPAGNVGPIAAHGDDFGPMKFDGRERHVGRPLIIELFQDGWLGPDCPVRKVSPPIRYFSCSCQ